MGLINRLQDGYLGTVDPRPATGHFVTILTAVVSPTSRTSLFCPSLTNADSPPGGTLTLASSDPFAFPTIDPNFFTTAFDQFTMVQAVKTARDFVNTPAWHGFIIGPFGGVGGANTDDEIVAAARQEISSIFHPVSTASMSPKSASWGVVDPELLVKGTSGIRIVDASVIVSKSALVESENG